MAIVHLPTLPRQGTLQADSLQGLQKAVVLILPTKLHIEVLKSKGLRLVHRSNKIFNLRPLNPETPPEAA